MCHSYVFISANLSLRVAAEACALLLAQNISKYNKFQRKIINENLIKSGLKLIKFVEVNECFEVDECF
jgi:hypothetical protein